MPRLNPPSLRAPSDPGRRRFLEAGALLTGLLWPTSAALLALAPDRAWALELQSLDRHAGATLLGLTRHIFPHATLDDAVYALVVKDLDTAAGSDGKTRERLAAGVAALDHIAGEGGWITLAPAARLAIVERIAHSKFFDLVRSTAVVSLYNNELAFAHFGYQGESFSKGGYLHRGFDDLTWLPAPPLAASPEPYHPEPGA